MSTVKTNSWNWDNVKNDFWYEPAADMYYFPDRWKKNGLRTVLDLGCGVGRHALMFARHGFEVTAFDLSESGLRKLSEKAAEERLDIKTIHGDFLTMDFPGDSFDAVIAYHSIYHIDSAGMKAVIEKTAGLLKPGGEFYCTMLSKNAGSYSDPDCPVIDDNVRMKTEEDGSVLPHFFADYADIKALFLPYFKLLRIQQIEDIIEDKSHWHYFVHLSVP